MKNLVLDLFFMILIFLQLQNISNLKPYNKKIAVTCKEFLENPRDKKIIFLITL